SEPNCNLKVSSEIETYPDPINTKNGKLLITINNGSAPFNIIVKNLSQSNYIVYQSLNDNNLNHLIVSLTEGIYQIIVKDKLGRSYEGNKQISSVIPDANQMKTDFDNKKHIYLGEYYKCVCNLERIENWQKGLRIAIATIGLAGTISSAGAGSLLAGILSGTTTTAISLYNEFVSESKFENLSKKKNQLEEINRFYNNFDIAIFNNWKLENYLLLDSFNKKVFSLDSKIDQKHNCKCSPDKLLKDYNWRHKEKE
ncbi:MAG TPA: hypothetical protein VIH57_05445, partial [Bacteroidales bacterium]